MYPLPPFFSQVLLLSMMPYSMGHPFGPSGSAVLVPSPPRSLCTFSLINGRAAQKAEKSLALCKHRSTTIENISMLSPLFSPKIQNTVLCKLLQRNLYPSKNYDNFSYCYNPSDERLWTWTCIPEDIGSDFHSNYILFIPSYEVSWDRLLDVHCWVPCLYFI